MFAGVCGGIAETYGSDPTAVRLLTAVIGIVTGIIPMLIVYLVAAVVVPERPSGELPAAVAREPIVSPGRGAILVGVVLIVAGVAALGNEVLNVDWDVLWPVALIAFGGVIVTAAWRRSRTASGVPPCLELRHSDPILPVDGSGGNSDTMTRN